MSNQRLIYFLLFLLPVVFLQAQPIIQPEEISIEDGLSQGFISCMIQDQEGFLWFGTKNGLNRYDGNSFEVFSADFTDPYAISNDFVTFIFEEGDYLLISTANGDLNIFHKITKRFYKIKTPSSGEEGMPPWEINLIIQDSLGQYWLRDHANSTFWRMQLPEAFWENIHEEEEVLEKIEFARLPQSPISSAWLSDQGQTLITTDGKKMYWKTKVQTLESNQFSAGFKPHEQILGSINIGNDTSLFVMKNLSEPGGRFESKIKILQNDTWINLGEVPGKMVNTNFYTPNKQWLMLYEHVQRNAFFFNKSALNYQQLKYEDATFSVPSKGARFISNLVDHSDNIWLGTDGLGIKKINLRETNIQTIFEGKSIYQIPYVFEDGTVIVSNAMTGGRFVDIKGDEFATTGIAQLTAKPRNFFSIWNGLNDSKWIAWQGKNDDDSIYKVFHIPTNGTLNEGDLLVLNIYPTAFFQDEKTGIACFGSQEWIVHYNPITKQTKKYAIRDAIRSNGLIIFSITKTENRHWWLGTSGGLIEMTPTSTPHKDSLADFSIQWHRMDQASLSESSVQGLLNNEVATLLTDPKDGNILWLGTKGGGLHRLDTRTMTFSYLNEKNGLPNNVIYGVLSDDRGNLWMSSNKGIIRYNPETNEIKNYTKADGLQGDEFNTWAYGKTSNGELIFGGTMGLNIFHPDIFLNNPHTPSVKFTRLELNNQLVDVRDSTGILDRSITFTSSLTLPFSKNNITLHFAALEYSTPSKNRFRYYLEGSEEPWAHEGTRNDAQYLNVSPGTYTFRIKAANGDGVWSDEITELEIIILPPWYRTTLAYLIYALLIGLGVWQFLKFQKRRLQLQHKVEFEQKEKEQLKDLDEAKSRLYTNITHEFRTPLTVISGIANQLEGNPDKKGLIKRNSAQLLNLVNQMLDLRKLESGAITINKKQGDIIRFLRYLTESLKSYAEAKGLTIHFISDEEQLMMDFDAEKITRIHTNLLSNAIKFTPDGGNIYVQLAVDKKDAEEQSSKIILAVKDTGVGISAEKLPYIFDRFYQADNSVTRRGEGTGIGLTLVSELIKVMHGNIQVKSILGKGTTFIIQLPISNIAELANEADWKTQSTVENLAAASTESTNLNFPTDEKPKVAQATVLIVEDNADVIHYLISCLKDAYNIEIAMDGEEGINKALEEIPDLIVSDVMMPIKDGFELCETLKTDERTSHIPIVLLTAKADMEARLEGLQRGADAYLSKPFHQDELLLTLNNQLKLRKQLQARLAALSDEPLADIETQVAEQEAVQQHLQIENAFLQKIRTLVEQDLSESELGMPQLMRHLRMSRSQIYKKVKALTGRSPSQYIRSIRLHHAKIFLEKGELNVSEVAYDVGFNSPSYFSEAYFEEFGTRPNETRK